MKDLDIDIFEIDYILEKITKTKIIINKERAKHELQYRDNQQYQK